MFLPVVTDDCSTSACSPMRKITSDWLSAYKKTVIVHLWYENKHLTVYIEMHDFPRLLCEARAVSFLLRCSSTLGRLLQTTSGVSEISRVDFQAGVCEKRNILFTAAPRGYDPSYSCPLSRPRRLILPLMWTLFTWQEVLEGEGKSFYCGLHWPCITGL